QYKGLITTFNGPFYVPMSPYISICNKDEGDYDNLIYTVASNVYGQNVQGTFLGRTFFRINPKPAFTPTPAPITPTPTPTTVTPVPTPIIFSSVSCLLSVSSSRVAVGNRLTWVLRSYPSGYRAFWYGTKNDSTDVAGVDSGFVTQKDWLTDPYPAGSEGSYTRWMELRDSGGTPVCSTSGNPVSVSVISGASTATPTPIVSTPTPTPTSTTTLTPIPFNPSSGGYFTFSHNNGTLIATRDAWTFQIVNGMVGDTMYVNGSLVSPDGYSAVSKGQFPICTITSGTSCSATRVPALSDVGTWYEDVFINGVNKGRVIVTVVAPGGTTVTPVSAPVSQNRIYSLSEINDGDIIRGQGDIAVWIVKTVGEKRFKRWLFGPQIFQAYAHLGFDKVKNVSKETLNRFDTAVLIRKEGDTKVYELTDFVPGVRATRRWIPNADTFLQRGFDFESVYVVNEREFNFYTEGAPLPVSQNTKPAKKNPLTANISEAMARFFGWEN
ncbi:MAG: hypothetical protein Q8R34_01775, partial [bacterium]|nr:hypothetical protein [bacterium]